MTSERKISRKETFNILPYDLENIVIDYMGPAYQWYFRWKSGTLKNDKIPPLPEKRYELENSNSIAGYLNTFVRDDAVEILSDVINNYPDINDIMDKHGYDLYEQSMKSDSLESFKLLFLSKLISFLENDDIFDERKMSIHAMIRYKSDKILEWVFLNTKYSVDVIGYLINDNQIPRAREFISRFLDEHKDQEEVSDLMNGILFAAANRINEEETVDSVGEKIFYEYADDPNVTNYPIAILVEIEGNQRSYDIKDRMLKYLIEKGYSSEEEADYIYMRLYGSKRRGNSSQESGYEELERESGEPEHEEPEHEEPEPEPEEPEPEPEEHESGE